MDALQGNHTVEPFRGSIGAFGIRSSIEVPMFSHETAAAGVGAAFRLFMSTQELGEVEY
jgi:hypothetical protein